MKMIAPPKGVTRKFDKIPENKGEELFDCEQDGMAMYLNIQRQYVKARGGWLQKGTKKSKNVSVRWNKKNKKNIETRLTS